MMLKSCFNRTRTKAVLATDVSHGDTWCNMVYSNQRKDAEQDTPILNLGVADDFSTFLLIFWGVAVANYVFKYTLW